MTWIHSKSAVTHPGLTPGLSMCPLQTLCQVLALCCSPGAGGDGLELLEWPWRKPLKEHRYLAQQHNITPHLGTLGRQHELEPPQCSGSIPCSCTWDASITTISQSSTRKLLCMELTPARLQRRLPRGEMHGLGGRGVTSSQTIPQHNERNKASMRTAAHPAHPKEWIPSPSPAATDLFSG